MSTNRSSSGGVRNLRAMFEPGNDSTSLPTPSRGRSPAGSDLNSNGSMTPRRTSTVRSSFVPVDRSGQMGSPLEQTMSNEGESLVERSSKSFSMNEEQKWRVIAEVKETIEAGNKGKLRSALIQPVIPEAAVEIPQEQETGRQLHEKPTSLKKAAPKPPTEVPEKAGYVSTISKTLSGPAGLATRKAVELARITNEKATKTLTKSAKEIVDSNSNSKAQENGSLPRQPSQSDLLKDNRTRITHQSTSNGKTKASTLSAASAATKGTVSGPRHVPAPISTAREVAKKTLHRAASTRSPAKLPRTPTTPKTATSGRSGLTTTSTTTVKDGNGHATLPTKAASTKASRPLISAIGKPPGTIAAKKPVVSKTAPHAGPFVKPKPKSPTRPVALPASATAQTTSSSAKTAGVADGSVRNSAPIKSDSTLRRQSSTLKMGQRTSSIGAPPTKSAPRESFAGQAEPRRPSSRISNVGTKAPDEGFLARMMRPTASSANKTHEKVVVISGHSPKRAQSRSRTRLSCDNHKASRVVSGSSEKEDLVAHEPLLPKQPTQDQHQQQQQEEKSRNDLPPQADPVAQIELPDVTVIKQEELLDTVANSAITVPSHQIEDGPTKLDTVPVSAQTPSEPEKVKTEATPAQPDAKAAVDEIKTNLEPKAKHESLAPNEPSNPSIAKVESEKPATDLDPIESTKAQEATPEEQSEPALSAEPALPLPETDPSSKSNDADKPPTNSLHDKIEVAETGKNKKKNKKKKKNQLGAEADVQKAKVEVEEKKL